MQEIVELEDGWKQITEGAILKLHHMLEEDLTKEKFDNVEYMKYFT